MVSKSKGQRIGKPPSIHHFHTIQVDLHGGLPKTYHNLDSQFMDVASSPSHFIAPPTCCGNKATSSATFTAVASFSGHFLAPPT